MPEGVHAPRSGAGSRRRLWPTACLLKLTLLVTNDINSKQLPLRGPRRASTPPLSGRLRQRLLCDRWSRRPRSTAPVKQERLGNERQVSDASRFVHQRGCILNRLFRSTRIESSPSALAIRLRRSSTFWRVAGSSGRPHDRSQERHVGAPIERREGVRRTDGVLHDLAVRFAEHVRQRAQTARDVHRGTSSAGPSPPPTAPCAPWSPRTPAWCMSAHARAYVVSARLVVAQTSFA